MLCIVSKTLVMKTEWLIADVTAVVFSIRVEREVLHIGYYFYVFCQCHPASVWSENQFVTYIVTLF